MSSVLDLQDADCEIRWSRRGSGMLHLMVVAVVSGQDEVRVEVCRERALSLSWTSLAVSAVQYTQPALKCLVKPP